MIEKTLLLGILIFLIGFVSAECVVPTDGMIITEDTTFCEGEYYLPNGISIGYPGAPANDVILDCNGAKLIGNGGAVGIKLGSHSPDDYNERITVKNCNIMNYYYGIVLPLNKDCLIINNHVSNIFTYGISVSHGENNVIQSNHIENASYGISLLSSDFNEITENIITGGFHGFDIQWAENNILNGNIIKENTYGLTFWAGAKDNQIFNNKICNNLILDIKVYSLSSGNNGDENYCDNTQAWNDIGTIGCTYSCIQDQDNDGVLDEDDKCSDTEEEQIVYGCSCNQILELKPGKDTKENQEKCSKGIIDVFTKAIGWAKDLF